MTGTHAECWRRGVDAMNGRDWNLLHSLLAPDGVQHHATDGRGATTVEFRGADEIVEAHRRATEDRGMRVEVVDLAEIDDLVACFVLTHRPDKTLALTAVVGQFDADVRVARIYSQNVHAQHHLGMAIERFEQHDTRPRPRRARPALNLARGQAGQPTSTRARLTDQQRAVCLTVGAGATTRQAANALFLSPKTVEFHLTNAYRRLGIENRAQLANLVARDLIRTS
jgi:DNA-binding CsgD family transcriptional regulator